MIIIGVLLPIENLEKCTEKERGILKIALPGLAKVNVR